MQLQFPSKRVSCLRQLKSEIQTVEQTQELRMPEEMPDIGSVLNAWGQVLLRSKQWHDGYMTVSGGVMVWILYKPEGEVQSPQTVQAWIPFQTKFDLPEVKHDGSIWVCPLLKTVDARSTSARKMVARACISVQAQAYIQDEVLVYGAEAIPEDVQLRKQMYPMLLPMELGEKEFSLDEELALPSSAPPISKIVRFSLQPELIDKKVLSGKMIFRGMGLLHVLYMNDQDQMCTWDFEIPFSQYVQLDADYEQSADTSVLPVITGMELEMDSPDKLRLKAAVIGQYRIYDVRLVEIVDDAYSTQRDVELEYHEMAIPTILEQKAQTFNAEHRLSHVADAVVDLAFYPDQPYVRQSADECSIQLSGIFHVLYLDEQRKLCATVCRWNDRVVIPASGDVKMEAFLCPSGMPQALTTSAEMELRADYHMESTTISAHKIPSVCSLKLGQIRSLEPNRPSLIIRRKGNLSLWNMAKRYNSTVAAIEKVNGEKEEMTEDRILLIPIP